ncbi:MAG: hypothetical protein P1P84_08065 [Deferrisomatales bacterium]|nr:hypothetical protein [Deferrisomatales bacterium]
MAGNFTSYGDEISIMPVGLNVKYAREVARNLALDAGAGPSYSYAEHEKESRFSQKEGRNDWILGGQVFVDLTYKIRWFSIGINGKYQGT